MAHVEYPPESTPSSPRPWKPGSVVVLAMFALAAAAAVFAWLWKYNSGRQTLEFFGPEGIRLIRDAPVVEILIPTPAFEGQQPIGFVDRQGQPLAIYERLDISQAKGLVHARASLLDGGNYRLDPKPTSPSPWSEIIRFAEGDKELLLTISHPNGFVQIVSTGKAKHLVKKTADGWQDFLDRNMKLARQAAQRPMQPAPARTAPSE